MRAQVWNDNVYPHTERFKDREVTIPAKSFVEMDYDEAIEFKCAFTPVMTDGEKNPLPQSFKMIRVVGQSAGSVPLVCHATGKVAKTPEELATMNADNIGLLDADSRKELEELAALKAENAALKAKLSAGEAEAKRPGPGRPKKEA